MIENAIYNLDIIVVNYFYKVIWRRIRIWFSVSTHLLAYLWPQKSLRKKIISEWKYIYGNYLDFCQMLSHFCFRGSHRSLKDIINVLYPNLSEEVINYYWFEEKLKWEKLHLLFCLIEDRNVLIVPWFVKNIYCLHLGISVTPTTISMLTKQISL